MIDIVEDQIAACRQRYNIPAHVALSMARCACRICGSSVTMKGAACVHCGATGKQRSIHPNGNTAVQMISRKVVPYAGIEGLSTIVEVLE